MQKEAQAVSIVIPVFNEESHIRDCLEAIKKQTVKPLEVIVVDNNSTDNTVRIAKKYPFVKVVKESRQGRGFARSKGFDEAKGEIIGRIDADSVLSPDWIEVALNAFHNEDVQAITGLGRTNISILPRIPTLYSTLWSRTYYWNVHAYFRTITIWGANMALRKSMWQKIKSEVCLDDDLVHEDEDVSLLIAAHGGIILQVNRLIMQARKQSYHYFPKFVKYMLLARKTKKYHQQRGTFSAADFQKLSRIKVIPGMCLSILFGIPYVITSFLHWPVDVYMIRKRAHSGRRWLD